MIRREAEWSEVFWWYLTTIFGMADFRKLVVWQKANKLSVAVAEAVESMKGNAGSILRGQLLRSTFSIQANIAEGSSKKERPGIRAIRSYCTRQLDRVCQSSHSGARSWANRRPVHHIPQLTIGRGWQNAERPGEAFARPEIANSK